jgi:hypothetical protein
MQPLHWGANVLFLDPFPLPSGQRLTLTVTGWVSDVHPAPHVPPSAPRVGAEGGQGEGEGVPAVRRSTNADTGATLFQLITETHTLPANGSLTITALIASQSVPTIRRTGGPEARVPRLVHR